MKNVVELRAADVRFAAELEFADGGGGVREQRRRGGEIAGSERVRERVKEPWREAVVGSFEELLERVPRARLDWRYFMPGAREILAEYWLFLTLTNRRPTRKEFEGRMPRWKAIFESFRDLERVAKKGKKEEEAAKRDERGGACGLPLLGRAMVTEPVNEQGVVLLFGEMARELGFVVERIGTGFPDCHAARWVDGEWKSVRIEFEFLSSRFDHDPAGCDLVVCWEDDWKGCPVEVMELRGRVRFSKGQIAKGPNSECAEWGGQGFGKCASRGWGSVV